jgi:MarR family protein
MVLRTRPHETAYWGNEMDSSSPPRSLTSARQAAIRLGTTIPRVKRAIKRLELPVVEGPAGRVGLTAQQFTALRRHLGSQPALKSVTRTQARVLSALARAPLGVASARSAAARAGISPTAASSALKQLEQRELVLRESQWLAAGRARQIETIRANVASPAWAAIAPQLGQVNAPRAIKKGSRPAKVPPRLRHLFWNVSPSQLRPRTAGGFIARRLLTSGDLDGLAWGAANLAPKDWRHAAGARGLDARQKALAENLAQGKS